MIIFVFLSNMNMKMSIRIFYTALAALCLSACTMSLEEGILQSGSLEPETKSAGKIIHEPATMSPTSLIVKLETAPDALLFWPPSRRA